MGFIFHGEIIIGVFVAFEMWAWFGIVVLVSKILQQIIQINFWNLN